MHKSGIVNRKDMKKVGLKRVSCKSNIANKVITIILDLGSHLNWPRGCNRFDLVFLIVNVSDIVLEHIASCN